MKKSSQQEIEFLVTLKNTHYLFWRFAKLKRPDQDFSSLSEREISSLYKKYSKELHNEKIKEVIKLLLDYRILCIENSIASSEILYKKIEEHNGILYHYCPPNTIYTFRLTVADYRGTLSEYRYYSRRSKNFEKSIEQGTYYIGNIKPGHNGWVNSTLNISKNCTESIEAQNYILNGHNYIQVDSAIRQMVDNFCKLTGQYSMINTYVIFEYLGKKFSIDFQKPDILSEDEFILQW